MVRVGRRRHSAVFNHSSRDRGAKKETWTSVKINAESEDSKMKPRDFFGADGKLDLNKLVSEQSKLGYFQAEKLQKEVFAIERARQKQTRKVRVQG